MRYTYFTLLLLPLLTGCSCKLRVFYNTSYCQHHNITKGTTNSLDSIAVHSAVTLCGVYCDHFYAVQEYPALLFINAAGQTGYVLLTSSLQAAKGDFVSVAGLVVDSLLQAGVSSKAPVRMLCPGGEKVLYETHKFLAIVKRDYSRLYDKLRSEKRLPNSKLEWPDVPDWRLLVDEAAGRVILSFSAADLMYALEVDFVYPLENKKLQTIYVHEWFKGE